MQQSFSLVSLKYVILLSFLISKIFFTLSSHLLISGIIFLSRRNDVKNTDGHSAFEEAQICPSKSLQHRLIWHPSRWSQKMDTKSIIVIVYVEGKIKIKSTDQFRN